MPGPDDGDYSFEALYRALTDKERSGFGQCRDKVREHVRRLREMATHGTDPEWSPKFERGQVAAYDRVLKFLGREP